MPHASTDFVPPLTAALPDSDLAANYGTGMFGPAATAFTVD